MLPALALTDHGAGHGAEVQLLDHGVPLLQLPLEPHHLEDSVAPPVLQELSVTRASKSALLEVSSACRTLLS